eukprot:390972-Amorphochlora_amoeboformis.AAC.1
MEVCVTISSSLTRVTQRSCLPTRATNTATRSDTVRPPAMESEEPLSPGDGDDGGYMDDEERDRLLEMEPEASYYGLEMEPEASHPEKQANQRKLGMERAEEIGEKAKREEEEKKTERAEGNSTEDEKEARKAARKDAEDTVGGYNNVELDEKDFALLKSLGGEDSSDSENSHQGSIGS